MTFASATTSALALILAMILSRVFSKDDYATYRQSLLVFSFLGPFLGLGLSGSLMYFIPRNPERSRAALTDSYVVLLVTGGLFALSCLTFGRTLIADWFNNPELAETVPWVGLFGVGMLLSGLLPTALLALQQSGKAAVHHGGNAPACVLVCGRCGGRARDAPHGGHGTSDCDGTCGDRFILHCRSVFAWPAQYPVVRSNSRRAQVFDSLDDSRVCRGSGHRHGQGPGVNCHCSPEEFALFVNGAMEIPFIGMLTGAVAAVILPEVVRMFRDEKKGEAIRLWRVAAVKSGILLFPLGGVLFLYARELMTLLYSGSYEESSVPFRIYLLLLPARAAFFAVIFQAAKRPDIILRRAIGTLVLNVLVSIPLIGWLGPNGAAMGTALVFWAYVIPVSVYCAARVSMSGRIACCRRRSSP